MKLKLKLAQSPVMHRSIHCRIWWIERRGKKWRAKKRARWKTNSSFNGQIQLYAVWKSVKQNAADMQPKRNEFEAAVTRTPYGARSMLSVNVQSLVWNEQKPYRLMFVFAHCTSTPKTLLPCEKMISAVSFQLFDACILRVECFFVLVVGLISVRFDFGWVTGRNGNKTQANHRCNCTVLWSFEVAFASTSSRFFPLLCVSQFAEMPFSIVFSFGAF